MNLKYIITLSLITSQAFCSEPQIDKLATDLGQKTAERLFDKADSLPLPIVIGAAVIMGAKYAFTAATGAAANKAVDTVKDKAFPTQDATKADLDHKQCLLDNECCIRNQDGMPTKCESTEKAFTLHHGVAKRDELRTSFHANSDKSYEQARNNGKLHTGRSGGIWGWFGR